MSAGLGLWALIAACTMDAPCPAGTQADDVRSERISDLLGREVSAVICFGEVADRGVRDPQGRLLLDASTDERLLAARVVHLERHVAPDGLGEGCIAQLLREEALAWTRELHVRQQLQIVDPDCPLVAALGIDPSVEAVQAWLSSAHHPTAAGLRASHQRRCGR